MEKPGIIKGTYIRNSMAIFVLLSLMLSFPAYSFGGNQDPADVRMDYASMREGIQEFEDVINEAIASSFGSSTFAAVQKAKGAYLQGYGISYSFLINIHLAVIKTPFGQVRSKKAISLDEKMQRISQLKEKLILVLQNSGRYFQQLHKDERVAIVAFVEDRNFPGEPNANMTIVMSALKKDLEELGNKSDRTKEFKQRMKIIEY